MTITETLEQKTITVHAVEFSAICCLHDVEAQNAQYDRARCTVKDSETGQIIRRYAHFHEGAKTPEAFEEYFTRRGLPLPGAYIGTAVPRFTFNQADGTSITTTDKPFWIVEDDDPDPYRGYPKENVIVVTIEV